MSSTGRDNVANMSSKFCRDEFEAYTIYSALANSIVVRGNLRNALLRAAEDEYRHYSFWRRFTPGCEPRFAGVKKLLFMFAAVLFGVTAVVKILERMEGDTSKLYARFAEEHPEIGDEVEKMLRDEELHEKLFVESLDEKRVAYISSIALGISDALIELTGIYAGALGAFSNTLSAGLTGLLAGFSAAISMAVASYAQARHEKGKNPKLAAFFTGSAYIAVVLVLAAPYFILQDLVAAFASMIIAALIVVAYMSYLSAILRDESFQREFVRTAGLILGVSALLYILGDVLSKLLGVTSIGG